MKKQPPQDITEQICLIESPEESLGITMDKALIKQFARRIYDSMKEQLMTDREEAENLLNHIFSTVRIEIEELETDAQHNSEAPI